MKKGSTLVEVLVAISVFAIISVSLFTSFARMTKIVARQEALMNFDIICRDIAAYGDEYGKGWDMKYFGYTEHHASDREYYDENFNHIGDTEGKYLLEYTHDVALGDALIITVTDTESGRVIIDGLNYGGGRYAQ